MRGVSFSGLRIFPKLKTLVGDGRRILRSAGEKYDFIVGDAYRGLRNIPPHLVTKEFFTEARARLAPGGVFMLNLIGYRGRRGRGDIRIRLPDHEIGVSGDIYLQHGPDDPRNGAEHSDIRVSR